jgi:3-oxoacyl-[acyl-carrier protein] reductase
MKKTALVTGGTKGIGKGIVLELLKNSYDVIVNYSTDDTAAYNLLLETSNYTQNTKIHLVRMDLSKTENIDLFCTEIFSYAKKIDVLVFNAGLTDRNSFDQVRLDDWNAVWNTNVTIPFFLTQRLSNILVDNAVILFTGSLMGITHHSVSISYGVTKAAIHAMVKNLVKYFSERKIRINAIAPGFVDTEWQKNKSEEIRLKIENKIALGRFATIEEIADACLFLIKNSYMNGTILIIDGAYCYE